MIVVTPSRFLRAILGVFLFGVAVYSYVPGFSPKEGSVAYALGDDASITGIIMKKEEGEKTAQFTLERVRVNGDSYEDKILVYAPASTAELGDRVGFHCNLTAPHPFPGFRYDRWLAARQIYALCRSGAQPFLFARGEAHGVRVFLGKLHEEAVQTIDTALPDPHGKLLAGLLLGDNDFSDEWKEHFLRTGTSHVVAASGYNVALVSSLAFAFLLTAGLRRQYAYPFVLAAISGFVIIAGAEAAVTRAGIMGSIALTGTQLGRKSSPWNALLLTVAIMLALEPRLLRDDPGFQLSVLSTMGLMAFAKPISKKIEWIPEHLGLRESFACTLAATFATLPITVLSFHQLSLVGPLTNLLILPLVPYAMALGACGVIADVLLRHSAPFFLAPAWILLEMILKVIEAMSALPFAVLSV